MYAQKCTRQDACQFQVSPHILTQLQNRGARNTDNKGRKVLDPNLKNNLNANIDPNVIGKKSCRQVVYTGQFELCDSLNTLINNK